MKIKKILIGIDNSNFAEHAAAYGFNLARTLNAAVGLVHIMEPGVIAPTPTDGTLGLTGIGMTSDAMINPAEQMELIKIEDDINASLLKQTTERFGEGLDVTQLSDYGSTADGILNSSREFGADLIVIGTHHRTGFDRLLMGSVAEKVVRESIVPVLVVPMTQNDEA